jgi:hypothetical protein
MHEVCLIAGKVDGSVRNLRGTCHSHSWCLLRKLIQHLSQSSFGPGSTGGARRNRIDVDTAGTKLRRPGPGKQGESCLRRPRETKSR